MINGSIGSAIASSGHEASPKAVNQSGTIRNWSLCTVSSVPARLDRFHIRQKHEPNARDFSVY